jgi:hypothetical protein
MAFKFDLLRHLSRSAKLGGTAAVLALLLFGWSRLHYPYSYAEALFLPSLISASSNDMEKIDLAELMPGDWETVCESHGYDEPLHLTKYQKTFPTAGAMQDGSWGLIFIRSDGSFNLVSSSCRAGVYLHFSGNRCQLREKAMLVQDTSRQDWACKVLTTLPG